MRNFLTNFQISAETLMRVCKYGLHGLFLSFFAYIIEIIWINTIMVITFVTIVVNVITLLDIADLEVQAALAIRGFDYSRTQKRQIMRENCRCHFKAKLA